VNEFLALLNAVLPVLGVVAAGFAIRRLEWLTEEADASLMRAVVNLFTPCLIADTILGNAAFARADNVWLPPVLGFVTTAGGIGIGWVTRRWAGSGAGVRGERTYALGVGICNYGYIPLPLAQVLFSSGTVGVLFVQNIGVELAMWLLGLAVLSGRPWREGWRHLLNPPVYAIIGTLALNALVRRDQVPFALLQGAHLLGQCAIPLGLILIGATMADLLPELRQHQDWRLVSMACAVRLGVLPALILGVAWVLPASAETKNVLLLHAAMPAAVFPIVMARHFGGDAGTALRIVVGTSLASVIAMPLWLKVGMKMLGVGGGGF
jgi:hypothetical protein